MAEGGRSQILAFIFQPCWNSSLDKNIPLFEIFFKFTRRFIINIYFGHVSDRHQPGTEVGVKWNLLYPHIPTIQKKRKQATQQLFGSETLAY